MGLIDCCPHKAIPIFPAGAIPVIVDVDESITIDPAAIDDTVGPHTRAVIPVHMWGAVCDMNAIMEVAAKHSLRVIEDGCQAVGGSYEGRKVGTIGDIGAFSFNYFKNMTAGEGGAVVSDDPELIRRARCVIDPCQFYWAGREEDFMPFASNGTRANEFQGALLNIQLNRIEGIIDALRAQKRQILDRINHLQELGLEFTPQHSPDHECAAKVMLLLPTPTAAERFIEVLPAVIAGKTGRHNYVEWDQILMPQGAAHPLLNPYNMRANKGCRRDYSKDMCARSLEILDRTVMVATDPGHTQEQVDQIVSNIEAATLAALGKKVTGKATEVA